MASCRTRAQLRDFNARLLAERALSDAELALVRSTPLAATAWTRCARWSRPGAARPSTPTTLSPEHVERIGMRIAAKMPTLIAAWDRLRSGKAADRAGCESWACGELPVYAARPGAQRGAARAFDTYLMLLAEHGLNASTFAARVAIGAQADVYCAIVAAIGTLKGLLHGGANQKAMETFLAIGEPENARDYIEDLLARHERLMGVGHRIYKVEDPRVRHLRKQVQAVAAAEGDRQLVPDRRRRSGTGDPEHPHFVERKLNPNVEFYSAPLLYSLGLPLDLFTAAFAISRIAGWMAHIREQLADNRLIRPKADYGGPAPRAFVPRDQRG